jgi:hypothetical protein
VERRIAQLHWLETRTIFDAGQWEDAAASRHERRSLGQELQILKVSLPLPQNLQDKAACNAITITVGLGKMSQQEQRRWRKKLRRSPRATWLTTFREYLCRHPQVDRKPIYIDVRTTTEDDITVQVLAYLLQAEIISWDAIEPWVQHYGATWSQEIEGKRWGKYDRTRWFEKMRSFALPQEANALRPRDSTKPLDTMSLPEAARAWAVSEPQLRQLMPQLIRQCKVDGIIRKGRFIYIAVADVERLQNDEDIKAARTHHAAKPQRNKVKFSTAVEDTLIAQLDDEALQALIEELETRKGLAMTLEDVQAAMEMLEEAQQQQRQRQLGSDT